MFRARWVATLLIWAMASSLQSPAAADSPPFELSWSAPAECPSGEEAAAALQRLAKAGSRIEAARVEIVPLAGRWQATLSTRGAQRRLEGESCAAVVHALTVVLALAAGVEGANAAESAAGGLPAPMPSEQSAPVPAPLAQPHPADTTAAHELTAEAAAPSLAWTLRAGLMAELGLLPAAALGPQAALHLQHGRWSWELAGTYLLPRHAELAGSSSPQADIDWLGGQLVACHHPLGRLGICLGGEVGRPSGTGSGVDEPVSAAGWWLAATAGARASGGFSHGSPWSWQLGLSGALALARPEFGFDELGVLHRPSAVSVRLFVGLGWGR